MAMKAKNRGRYQPYPTYKDSGVEWIGAIPSHWEVRRLKYVAPVRDERCDAEATDLRFLGLEHIQSGTGRLVDAPTERDEEGDGAVGAASLFQASDVLFGKLRPYLAKVFCPDFHGCCSTEILVLRTLGDVTPSMLAYELISRDFIAWIDAMTYGTKMPRANPEQVSSMSVVLPPRDEQEAITAFLDRETAKIDALVAKKERLLELLDEKRTAIITQAVTKGLNPKAPMKASGFEWLGEIPGHWSVLALKRVTSIRYGLGEPPQDAVDGLPLIRATNVSRGEILDRDLALVDPGDVPWSRDPVLRTDDIVVVRSGAYTGDSAILPERYDGAIAGYDLVVKPKGIVPRFLSWVLLSSYVLDSQIHLQSLRAAQPHLNAEELGAVVVLLPPSSEQRVILAHVDKEIGELKALTAKTLDAIVRLRELRTALTSAAATGKIDVRDAVA